MKAKKDIIPIVIAAVIAGVITGLVRWLIPINVSTVAVKDSKEEISMPDIPLMARDKTKKKSWDVMVLVVSNDIKKGDKVSINNCSWKKWPADDIQSYFIVRDKDDVPLNNAADYANAMKMWAKNDIPHGIPLTVQMLDNMDPIKREEEERKKKQEAEKKNAQTINEAYIEKGMRAVTLVVDQKSSVFNNMLYPGDLIDVLIMERKGDRVKTHKYKALQVLAVDGSSTGKRKKTKIPEIASSSPPPSAPGTPIRNVTLEIKEDLVETIINQSSTSGIIISVRSQDEEVDESELNKDLAEANDGGDNSSIVNDILSIGRRSSVEKLLEKKEQAKSEDDLMSDILNINRKSSTEKLLEKRSHKEDESRGEEVLVNDIIVNRRSSTEKLLEKKLHNDGKSKDEEVLVNDIIVNRRSSAEKLLEKKLHKDDESKSEDNLMNDIIVNRRSSTEKLLEKKEQTKSEENLMNDIIVNRGSSTDKLLEKRLHKDDESKSEDNLMNDIIDINRKSSTEKLLEKKEQTKSEENLMNDIIVNRGSSTDKLLEKRERNEADIMLMNNINPVARLYGDRAAGSPEKNLQHNNLGAKGNYEVVSGKVLGDEVKQTEGKKAVIYKKLTAQEVKFDKDGNVSKDGNVK